jgi:hypothetical protein
MRSSILFPLFLLLIFRFPALGQEFQQVPSALVPYANGGMNWGDCNNDGALDL